MNSSQAARTNPVFKNLIKTSNSIFYILAHSLEKRKGKMLAIVKNGKGESGEHTLRRDRGRERK
jgi:hypothetical protein